MLSPKDLRLDVPAFATLNADRGAAQLGPFASFADFWSTFTARYVLELGLVFAAYLLAGRIGLIVPFTSGNVSPV
jgi:hypothetical protein